MKFIHTADLHLGKVVNGFSMLEDQEYILDEIIKIIDEEKPDGVFIAGDVYDKAAPPPQAVALFDDFLFKLSQRNLEIFIISGNHDSAQRLSFGSRIMEKSRVHISQVYEGETQKVTLEDGFGAIDIYMLPFIRPAQTRPYFPDEKIEDYTDALRCAIGTMHVDESKRNILLAHQFVTGAVTFKSEEIFAGGLDNVDADVFEPFDYVALGHLHGPQNIGSEKIRYSGTPLKYSFSECSHKKSVTVLEMHEKGSMNVRQRQLVPLRDMRQIKGSYEEVTGLGFYEGTKLQEEYVHITLTDEEDIPQALGRLRSIYHNLMKLDYDNKRTSQAYEAATETKKAFSPEEIFSQLYKLQNNSDMTKKQEEIIKELASQIWEDKQ